MLLPLQIGMLYVNIREHVIKQTDHFMSKERGRERGEEGEGERYLVSQVPSENMSPVICGYLTSSHLFKVLFSSTCTTL